MSSRNIEVDITNLGTQPVNAEITDTFGGSRFLDNSGDWRMSINRFNAPLTHTELVKFTDNTDYSIEINAPFAVGSGAATSIVSGSSTLFSTTENPIYSPDHQIAVHTHHH